MAVAGCYNNAFLEGRIDDESDLTMSAFLAEKLFFTFFLIKFHENRQTLSTTVFKNDQLSLPCIDDLCKEANNTKFQETNELMNHACMTPGCTEGVVTIDGNNKLHRPICAAERKRLKFGRNMPKIMERCPFTPLHARDKEQKASRFCEQHQYVEQVTEPERNDGKLPDLVIDLKEFKCSEKVLESTSDLPKNDDETVMIGCKCHGKVPNHYKTTAGILAMVRPCGLIIPYTEMFNFESCTQVFTFVLRSTDGDETVFVPMLETYQT